MILSDGSIERALDDDLIGVSPRPDAGQIQPASLDVRLGQEFSDERAPGQVYKRDTIRLAPGIPYLGHTMESIHLPNYYAAQLAGRSTIGRKGVIVHKTAGWIDPGFEGQITLEIMNLSSKPVELDVGSRVAQLVFFQLDQPSSGYDGHYQGQKGATEAYNE